MARQQVTYRVWVDDKGRKWAGFVVQEPIRSFGFLRALSESLSAWMRRRRRG